MPAVDDGGHVDVDDVAVLELAVAGNAVAHDVVDRDAAALGVAAIAERGRKPAGVDRHAIDEVVDFLRGDAGDHVRRDRVEQLGGETTGAAHAFEALGPVQLDDAIARFDPIIGGDGEVLSHGPKIGTEQAEVEWEQPAWANKKGSGPRPCWW